MKNNNFHMFLKKSELCKAVLLMNKDIHFVAVINKNGRITESEFSNDSEYLSSNELEMIAMQRSLQTSMIREFDQKLSQFNQTITMRKHTVEFVTPLGEDILFVISNIGVDVKHLSTALSSMIFSFDALDAKPVVA